MTTRSTMTLRGFICSACGVTKPPEEFYADPRGGIRSRCCECMNAQQRARRAADPDARTKDANRRERAREDIISHQKAWRRRNQAAYLWQSAKQRARRDGREFSIALRDIIIPNRCPVLGIVLVMGDKPGYSDAAPSIDRIDNTKGYVPGNVRVISMKANVLKGSS